MTDFEVDLSFLNYRDDEDTARDACIYWKYFSKKFHSPVMNNMLEWADVTRFVPPKSIKPTFADLPKFKECLASMCRSEEERIWKQFGIIYLSKWEQAEEIHKNREMKRRHFQVLHERAWKQKEARDQAIQRVKDKYYWAKNKIDRAEYATFFVTPARQKIPTFNSETHKAHLISRRKTLQEVFQDLMDWHYAEGGNEENARVEAEMCLALKDQCLNMREIDLTVPATARGVSDPDFDQKAFGEEVEDRVILPKRVEALEEIQARWSDALEANLKSGKERFLAKDELEESKPARVDQERPNDDGFDVFQVMEAWARKYCGEVDLQTREALVGTRSLGRKDLGMDRPVLEQEEDSMLLQAETWKQEELNRRKDEFMEKFKCLEEQYKVFCWLPTVDIVKDFICKENLLLEPKYDVQETVTQVAILTFIYLNEGMSKEKVEEYADEFLNSWIRLQDQKSIPSQLHGLLMREFLEQAIALTRDNYPLLGTWQKVRQISLAILNTTADPNTRFNFHTRLRSTI
ncbi:Hypothetical predicted protein [Cloeon dipterum]|uniref:Uncharacterized protein n=1 Tax=Cloeon dipterum TaxID=197152 RepID=A0A8S1BUJ0_9INSE|nr:Hypothetical predicted protein [Cloeon dipterum]